MMMNRARRVPLAALALASALLLSACGKSSGTTNDSSGTLTSGAATGTLEIWAQGSEAEALPKLLKSFEAENPKLKINVTPIPWESALNKYSTAVAGRTTPDIGQIGTTWVAGFSNALQTVPSNLDTSGVFDSALSASKVGTASLGVPWYIDARAVFYRKDLAAKAGYTQFPSTWDGFRQMTKAMQTKAGSKWGIILPTSQTNGFTFSLIYPWSFGAKLLSADQKKWTLNTSEMAKGLSYYQSFFTDKIADPNEASTVPGDIAAKFVSGQSPVMIDGPYMMGVLAGVGGQKFSDKYAVATLPSNGTSFLGGSLLSVFKDSKNPQAAWKLINWLSQPKQQIAWYKLTGDLPSAKSAWNDPTLTSDPRLAVFGKQIASSSSTPNVSTWNQIAAKGDQQLEQIARTGKDPSKALAELQQFADSVGTGE